MAKFPICDDCEQNLCDWRVKCFRSVKTLGYDKTTYYFCDDCLDVNLWGYVGRMSLPFIKSITRAGTRDLIPEHFGEPDNHVRNKDAFIKRFEQVFFGPKSTYKSREEWLLAQPAKELVFLIERYGLNYQKKS